MVSGSIHHRSVRFDSAASERGLAVLAPGANAMIFPLVGPLASPQNLATGFPHPTLRPIYPYTARNVPRRPVLPADYVASAGHRRSTGAARRRCRAGGAAPPFHTSSSLALRDRTPCDRRQECPGAAR